MSGGSMGHGFSYQLIMEQCMQLSENKPDQKDKMRGEIEQILVNNVNVENSSLKGIFYIKMSLQLKIKR